ncbi:hypothetical protein SANTM175S_10239 [Streptomyces antimycoticus]
MASGGWGLPNDPDGRTAGGLRRHPVRTGPPTPDPRTRATTTGTASVRATSKPLRAPSPAARALPPGAQEPALVPAGALPLLDRPTAPLGAPGRAQGVRPGRRRACPRSRGHPLPDHPHGARRPRHARALLHVRVGRRPGGPGQRGSRPAPPDPGPAHHRRTGGDHCLHPLRARGAAAAAALPARCPGQDRRLVRPGRGGPRRHGVGDLGHHAAARAARGVAVRGRRPRARVRAVGAAVLLFTWPTSPAPPSTPPMCTPRCRPCSPW